MACGRGDLGSKPGHPFVEALPGLRQWQNDGRQISPVSKKVSDILVELASLARGNDETEGFHDTPDLVLKLCGHPAQPAARTYKCACQHAFETFYANCPVEADFGKMRQTVSIIRISLVSGHVERSFRVARINAYHRDPHGVQRVKKPHCERPCLKDNAFGRRCPLADEG